jgi:hypothetical protein
MPFLIPLIWSGVVALFTTFFRTALISLMGALWKIISLALSIGIGSLAATLGVGFITYTGFGILLDEIYSQFVTYFTALPTEILQIMGLMKLDICLNIIFSAYATRFLIRNVYDSFKKMNFNGV